MFIWGWGYCYCFVCFWDEGLREVFCLVHDVRKDTFSCVSLRVFLFHFCKHPKILRKLGDFAGWLRIWFPSSNVPPCSPDLFHHIWHMCVVLYRPLNIVHIFGIQITSGELGRTIRPSLNNSRSSPPLKCWVGWMSECRCWFRFSPSFSNRNSYVVIPCFPRVANISSSVVNVKSLLLITPFEESSLSCG